MPPQFNPLQAGQTIVSYQLLREQFGDLLSVFLARLRSSDPIGVRRNYGIRAEHKAKASEAGKPLEYLPHLFDSVLEEMTPLLAWSYFSKNRTADIP